MKRWNFKKHIILCLSIFLLLVAIYFISQVIDWGIFNVTRSESIGIIGGADGPTVIFISSGSPGLGFIALAWFVFAALLTVSFWPIRWMMRKIGMGGRKPRNGGTCE